jgi:hypothetical protein
MNLRVFDMNLRGLLGRGYDEAVLDVVTPEGTVKAVAYVASAQSTDPGRRPYHWYKRLVLAGAIEHDLPADAVAAICAVPSQDDPMPRRRTKRDAEEALAARGIAVD